jgi:hypothetical protein
MGKQPWPNDRDTGPATQATAVNNIIELRQFMYDVARDMKTASLSDFN